MSTDSMVSFTVRRPTPVSRQSSSGPESDREGSFKVPALPRHISGGGSSRSTPQSPLIKESTPNKRHELSKFDDEDSSDEGEGAVDEIVTGFDQFGVQRCVDFSCALFVSLFGFSTH